MAADAPLNDALADDLRAVLAHLASLRLPRSRWTTLANALTRLRDALRTGSVADVLVAYHWVEDRLPVRVRTEPGPEPIEGPPDEIAHLVHEIELAARDRTGSPNDATADQ